MRDTTILFLALVVLCLSGALAVGRDGCSCSPEVHSQVCWRGHTYLSLCKATCDGAVEAHVTAGPCPESSSSGSSAARHLLQEDTMFVDGSDCACSNLVSPVCGQDGKTYLNQCAAQCKRAPVAYEGRCVKAAADCACPQEYKPVCSIDYVTYDNECLALCDGSEVQLNTACPGDPAAKPAANDTTSAAANTTAAANATGGVPTTPVVSPAGGVAATAANDVANATENVTAAGNVTGSLPGCVQPCSQELEPVCGVDQRTYANPCIAACRGVAVATTGFCAAITATEQVPSAVAARTQDPAANATVAAANSSSNASSNATVAATNSSSNASDVTNTTAGVDPKAVPSDIAAATTPNTTVQPAGNLPANAYASSVNVPGGVPAANGAAVNTSNAANVTSANGTAAENITASGAAGSTPVAPAAPLEANSTAADAANGTTDDYMYDYPYDTSPYDNTNKTEASASEVNTTAPQMPACELPCPLEQDPVCGVDQKTYANPCSAGCSGIAVASKGYCPFITADSPEPPAANTTITRTSLEAGNVSSDVAVSGEEPPQLYNTPPAGDGQGVVVAANASNASCPTALPTMTYRPKGVDLPTDFINTTESISPLRPSADVGVGGWIPGRATFYGADQRLEDSRTQCGEPPGQYGIIQHGSCGYTNSDESLPYPIDGYAAVADTNQDYPGSCGRCYQIRCRTGSPENNGRPIRISDLKYYKPYLIEDNWGRNWPGNPFEKDDLFYTQCWEDKRVITVRVGDSCQCKYYIKYTGEVRTQNWCCGGQNHFDLSFWAFQKLAHPSYGVMKMEYRPVSCDTGEPLAPLPGFVNQTIYSDGIEPGWGWRPYFSKDTQLRAKGQGLDGGNATCATASKDGAMAFFCRNCTNTGYQPFAKAQALRFWIRSNTQSTDPYASSTPRGKLPPLKVFLMHDEENLYCGAEVIIKSKYVTNRNGSWYRVSIPLKDWECEKGSAGSLEKINRVDFQNINIRDANFCLDRIALV